MNNNQVTNQDAELMNQFESFLRKEKQTNQANFKAQWDNIVSSCTTKQYFNWHYSYFKGDLSYRSMAETMKKSTKSLGLRLKCDKLLETLTNAGF